QTLDLLPLRARGDDHAIEIRRMAGLEQERHADNDARVAVDELEGADAGLDGAVDRGMYDRLEIAPRRRVGEDDRTESGAIDATIETDDLRSESRRDGRGRLRAGSGDAVRELVGVQARNAALLQPIEHVALPGRDAAGQRHSQHAQSVHPALRYAAWTVF